MVIQKLNELTNALLDTGKKNNLINFKNSKSYTVEVLFPEIGTLFKQIGENISFEVYDPKLYNSEEDPNQLTEPIDQAKYKNKYSTLSKRQILLYNHKNDPITVLRNIDKKSKEFAEETGVNIAYMAFGFIYWKESVSSRYEYQAPLLLTPIAFERESLISPYYIKFLDDDFIVNPTFAHKLEDEYGINLPEYNDEGLFQYLERISTIVKNLKWSVAAECKIALFSFLKINMYRDLKDNEEAILKNPNIRILLGDNSFNNDSHNMSFDEYRVSNPLIELHNVVDADSSQIEAIQMAKSGKSFVLQGPPGTGKSQTITNIIAECLSDNKKVLFVSEKQAALNVVYEKLKKAGLSEFCLELHSHKANKKNVIAELCHTLNLSKSIVSPQADEEIVIKEETQKKLDAYAEELHKVRPVIDRSLYQLFELYSKYRNIPDINWTVPDIPVKGQKYLIETSSLLEQYVEYIPYIGYDYKKNPWYGYQNQNASYQEKILVKSDLQSSIKFISELLPITEDISTRYNVSCKNSDDAEIWLKFLQLTSTTKFITPALLKRDFFVYAGKILNSLQKLSEEILSTKSTIDSIFDKDIYKINGTDYHKRLTKQFNGVFSHIFNAEYKELIRNLSLCKIDGKKLTYNEAVAATNTLHNYQEKLENFASIEQTIKDKLGETYCGINTNWVYVRQQMEALQYFIEIKFPFGILTNYSYQDFEAEQKIFSDFVRRLEKCFSLRTEAYFRTANYFDSDIFNFNFVNCMLALTKCKDCLNEIDRLDNWCHFRILLSQISDKQAATFLDYVISQNIESKYITSVFAKNFYFQWIDYIISGSSVLSTFNRISQDKAIKTFVQKDKEQLEINKAKIKAKLSAYRPSLDFIAAGSAVSILLRENQKKRKQKNIRTLLSEIGELVQIIKPCFLMSPLSISTFLNNIYFDVVIFDEASQIFTQDAIGAIYRAKQLIVVGDSKQMPPTSFFQSTTSSEDLDSETENIKDYESILDLCLASMESIKLRWHYRSKYEQLISFSNKNFYDNDLITFPSSKANTLGIGVDYYHINGVFDRKSHTNLKEAEFIVNLIYQNIEQFPNRSLGVVAFSVAQQTLIDKLLSQKRQSTPEKEYFFSNDKEEPFFIKNLETVQGDERDTIIFSVAYARDTQGKFFHNFGPVSRPGGERRLNVAVTRAKCNVQLVSSIHYNDIDLTHTSMLGSILLREYLDFAENGEVALQRSITVNTSDHFDSDFELEVCEFLRSKGFSVDTQVGCSGFKIDLGLRQQNSSDYALAIECDGATYHSSKNARDRDRLRQEILENMGWKFYRIWSTDWFHNKNIEQLRLLDAAINALHSSITKNKLESNVQDSFEESIPKIHIEFPKYKVANINELSKKYFPEHFKELIKAILEIEAPLSEEFLLKRIVGLFGREKVTSVVRNFYEEKMLGCQNLGIIRRNGFLYLKEQRDIPFRVSGDLTRDIKYISPEELASGMMCILQQNITAEKNGLYRALASQCGIRSIRKQVNNYFDAALALIKDNIRIEDNIISINKFSDQIVDKGTMF